MNCLQIAINRKQSALLACIFLGACGTGTQSAAGKVADFALSSIGIKKLEAPSLPPASTQVSLRIEASKDLNAGEDGQGLTTVVRVYKLRDHNNFLSTPYSGFGSSDKEKQAIGTDLIEVRELTLAPGQRLELKEKMAGDAAYLGIVALFRSPVPQRWRFAFATADAEGPGITVGVHACAMTATNIAPMGLPLSESALLSSVRCR